MHHKYPHLFFFQKTHQLPYCPCPIDHLTCIHPVIWKHIWPHRAGPNSTLKAKKTPQFNFLSTNVIIYPASFYTIWLNYPQTTSLQQIMFLYCSFLYFHHHPSFCVFVLDTKPAHDFILTSLTCTNMSTPSSGSAQKFSFFLFKSYLWALPNH